MGILFKRISNALKNMSWDFDDIYLGAETPGNKVLKTDQVPVASNQVYNVSGTAVIKTLFLTPTGSLINFNSSGSFGLKALPLYDTFSFFEPALIEGNKLNKWDVLFSCNTLPNILVPNKPTSPLAPYADQATMLAGQGGQVSGQHYYYTGSSSAWLWNGVSGGVIGNYTEVPEIAGWDEAGTKPSYLSVTGTILEGYEHLNRLVFLLDYDYDAVGDVVSVKVFLTITQWENANEDPSPPPIYDPNLLVKMMFNENVDLVASPNILNESINELDFEATIAGANNITYSDLTGANYGIRLGTNQNGNPRGKITISNPDEYYSGGLISVLAKFKSGVNTGNRIIAGNFNNSTLLGWRFVHRTDNTLRVELATAGTRTTNFNITIPPGGGEDIIAGFTYDGTSVRIYAEIPSIPIAWGLKNTSTRTNELGLISGEPIRLLGEHESSTGVEYTEFDYLFIWNRVLSDLEMEEAKTNPSTIF